MSTFAATQHVRLKFRPRAVPALWVGLSLCTLMGCGTDNGPPGTDGAALADVKAINAAGPAMGSFAADEDFSGTTLTATWTHMVDTSGVSNPAPEAVYQSERYGKTFTYTIPQLTSGAPYTVRLHFSEDYWSAAGSRLFNVALNGSTVLSSFDIFAKAGGPFKAIVEQFNANASSAGQIVIAFSAVKDNAVIDGIEIQSASSTTSTLVNNRSGLCLGANGSKSSGATVEQLTCNGSPDQQFKVLAIGGFYQLTDMNSGLCLRPQGGGTAPNTTLIQDTCNTSDTSQQYSLQSVSAGVYYLVNNKSGLCITDRQDLQTSGNPQEIYTCIQSDSQAFRVALSTGAPANLKYSTNPLVVTQGHAISPDAPSFTGGAPTSYAVSPALPAGLTLNSGSGVISGTPTAPKGQANYVVTASNASGSTQTTVAVTVDAVTTSCGMFPCFEALYPHSPLLATIPANPKLDLNDRTLVAQLFNRTDGKGNAASTTTSAFPLYTSTCSDPGYTTQIGQPTWYANQPQGQTVHFPAGAVWEGTIFPNGGDHHISVFDTCSSSYGVWDAWAAEQLSNGVFAAATVTRVPAYSVPSGCIADSNHYSDCQVDGLRSAEGHGGFASAAVVRGQELVNGAINHALILATVCANNVSGIYPALAGAPDSACSQTPGAYPTYGQRFYLALNDAQIDALFPASEEWKKPYWKALARYGAYISDTGWTAVQAEAEEGYKAVGQPNPFDALRARYGLSNPVVPDFRPNSSSAWNTLYQNIHAIAVDAPPPVGP